MICGFASNTCMPAYGGTVASNSPRVSTGTTASIPAASVTTLSSSPKAGRDVHEPGAVVGRDVVGGEHPVGVLPALEEVERRRVGGAEQLGAGQPAQHARVVPQLAGVRAQPGRGEDEPLAVRRRSPLTSTYSTSGCTATARFDGSVHGVVVQTRAYAPSRSGVRRRAAAARR